MTWRDDAACSQEGAEPIDFHSEEPAEIDRALAMCNECPVKRQCLQFALDNYERFGVWGGRTEVELRKALSIDQRGAPVLRKTPLKCPYCGSSSSVVELPELITRRQLHCQLCDTIWRPKKVLKVVKGGDVDADME